MVEIICKVCGQPFEVYAYRAKQGAKFCSTDCRNEYQRGLVGKKNPHFSKVTNICKTCGREYQKKKSHAARSFFCCRDCKTIGIRRRRQSEIEEQFGEPIKPLLERLYYDEKMGIKQIAKHINVSDRNLWNWFDELGIERRDKSEAVTLQWVGNDERKEQITEIFTKSIKSYYANGGISPAKLPHVRKKISQAKMGKKNWMYGRFGAKNPMWQGGKITYRGKGWDSIRVQVKRRDKNKCRRCGTDKDLTVHHIVPYRETQDNSFDNLVTLCRKCHIKVEHHGATWD